MKIYILPNYSIQTHSAYLKAVKLTDLFPAVAMTESDSIVHKYLLTVSEKLAKQFAKKRPNPTPWTGPTLDLLIDFYKRKLVQNIF